MLSSSLSKKLILFILVYASNILALSIDIQLIKAAMKEDLEQIDNLINQGADVNIKIGGDSFNNGCMEK